MKNFFDTLENRCLFSVGVNAELFGVESAASVVSAVPLKRTKAPVVPPVGGRYVGSVTSATAWGQSQPGMIGVQVELKIYRGSRRTTGEIVLGGKYLLFGFGTANLRGIMLSGKKMGGSAFAMTGSDGGFSGNPGSIDVKVSGTVSADGRKISGSYRTELWSMAGPAYNMIQTGKFSTKRVKG